MQQLQRAARGEPSFILENYFAGRTRAWGMFMDRFGGIRRQFSVDILGDIENDQLVLTEDFAFDDGERSQRIWRITSHGDGHYSGTADDVVGIAKGEVAGNCFRWSYDLNLTIGQRVWRVHFDDVMVLQSEQILLNRASMSKCGVMLGEVIICFQKEATRVDGNMFNTRPIGRGAGKHHTREQGEASMAVSA